MCIYVTFKRSKYSVDVLPRWCGRWLIMHSGDANDRK